MQEYLTIEREYESSFEINRSKFICYLAPSETIEEGLAFVNRIRKKHADATHNCYAIIGAPYTNEQKFSDDGEPGGTAGQPMYNVMNKQGLYGLVAVVTRYFGGIKLGAGGLVSAYSKAVADAVKIAEVVTKIRSLVASFTLTYNEYKYFNQKVESLENKILDTQYGGNVTITLACPEDYESRLETLIKEITSGRSSLENKEYKYITYKR